MKIVIVNDTARIVGGAAKIAIMSARALAERGHNVVFIAGSGPVGPELSSSPGTEVHCLSETAFNVNANRFRAALRGIWNRKAAQELGRILSGFDPRETVVHFHAYRDALTASVAHRAIRMGFATVYTAHEYTLGCPYAGFFDYRRNSICHLPGLGIRCSFTRCNRSGFWEKLFHQLAQAAYRASRIPKRLDHVIFISKLNRRVLEPYIGPKVRRSVVSNPSDYTTGLPAPIVEGSPFVFVGSLEQHKDPVTAARAAKMLGAPIVFVGSGSEESAVREANPDAIITGWIGREEVERHIRSARALVFPSIWYEAQPLTPIEAAACGLPLIISDASAAVELVEALGVGEVFAAGNVEALAEKMRPYLDIAFAQAQGWLTGEAFAKLDFGEDLHISRLIGIYESELAARKR